MIRKSYPQISNNDDPRQRAESRVALMPSGNEVIAYLLSYFQMQHDHTRIIVLPCGNPSERLETYPEVMEVFYTLP